MSDVAGSRRSLEGSYGEKTKRAFHGPGGRGSDERQGVINVAMYISRPLPHPLAGQPQSRLQSLKRFVQVKRPFRWPKSDNRNTVVSCEFEVIYRWFERFLVEASECRRIPQGIRLIMRVRVHYPILRNHGLASLAMPCVNDVFLCMKPSLYVYGSGSNIWVLKS